MKAYLINLDRSQERLVRMEQQFAEIGLSFERISAVDGKLLSDDEVTQIKRNPGWKKPLTLSEIGCFLSHRKCMEALVQSGEKFAAVFEDDVQFSQHAKSFFNDDTWLPDDIDLIKLETHGRKVLLDQPRLTVAGTYDIARLHSQNILSAGYIISGKCAARLLSCMNDAAAPMDHFLFTPACGFFNEMKVYQVDPVICTQAGLVSTLSTDRTQNQHRPPVWFKVVREIIRPFQRLKVFLRGVYINRFTKQRWMRVRSLDE